MSGEAIRGRNGGNRKVTQKQSNQFLFGCTHTQAPSTLCRSLYTTMHFTRIQAKYYSVVTTVIHNQCIAVKRDIRMILGVASDKYLYFCATK